MHAHVFASQQIQYEIKKLSQHLQVIDFGIFDPHSLSCNVDFGAILLLSPKVTF
jgi:hypothetical protein